MKPGSYKVSHENPRKIYLTVFYDESKKGFYYQIKESTPLMGPFKTNREAVVDASFKMEGVNFNE